MLFHASVVYLDYGEKRHIKKYSIDAENVAEFYRILNEYIEADENENSWDMVSVEVKHEEEKTAKVS